jgi:hypothetical protein
MKAAAIILSGGKSSRMGTNKALLKISEKTKGNDILSDEVAQIKKLLVQNNVKLQADIPIRMPAMQRIKVMNQAADSDSVASKILGANSWSKKVWENGSIKYLSKGKELIVQKNGEIEYTITESFENSKILSNKSSVQKYIYEVLSSYNSLTNYQFKTVSENSGNYIMEFENFNNSYEMFNNNIKAIIDNGSPKRTVIVQGMVNFEGYT